MNHYETMLVTSATLDEEASAALIGKFKTLIEKNGNIESVEDWGKRRLAYPINKQTDGVYTLINFTSDQDFPAELDRRYKITDGVIRSLIIAKTDEQLAAEAKAKDAKAAQAKAAAERAAHAAEQAKAAAEAQEQAAEAAPATEQEAE